KTGPRAPRGHQTAPNPFGDVPRPRQSLQRHGNTLPYLSRTPPGCPVSTRPHSPPWTLLEPQPENGPPEWPHTPNASPERLLHPANRFSDLTLPLTATPPPSPAPALTQSRTYSPSAAPRAPTPPIAPAASHYPTQRNLHPAIPHRTGRPRPTHHHHKPPHAANTTPPDTETPHTARTAHPRLPEPSNPQSLPQNANTLPHPQNHRHPTRSKHQLHRSPTP
ncbi:hypothetical protein BJ508DRAFT_189641, partial [Ascobolus immersus RN42]